MSRSYVRSCRPRAARRLPRRFYLVHSFDRLLPFACILFFAFLLLYIVLIYRLILLLHYSFCTSTIYSSIYLYFLYYPFPSTTTYPSILIAYTCTIHTFLYILLPCISFSLIYTFTIYLFKIYTFLLLYISSLLLNIIYYFCYFILHKFLFILLLYFYFYFYTCLSIYFSTLFLLTIHYFLPLLLYYYILFILTTCHLLFVFLLYRYIYIYLPAFYTVPTIFFFTFLLIHLLYYLPFIGFSSLFGRRLLVPGDPRFAGYPPAGRVASTAIRHHARRDAPPSWPAARAARRRPSGARLPWCGARARAGSRGAPARPAPTPTRPKVPARPCAAGRTFPPAGRKGTCARPAFARGRRAGGGAPRLQPELAACTWPGPVRRGVPPAQALPCPARLAAAWRRRPGCRR